MKNIFVVIGALFVVISSCEKPGDLINNEQFQSEEISQREYIDIANFENPEAMWEESNKKLYAMAYNRFMSKVSLKNGRYQYDIESGAEIGVSEPIFAYIIDNVGFLNSQVDDGVAVLLEENGEILYSEKTKKINSPSAIPNQQPDPIGMYTTGSSIVANQIGTAMARYGSGYSGNVGDYFTYNSYHYNRTGTATFAGQSVTFHVSSATSVYSTNNPNNSFVSYRERQMGGYTYFEIRNNQGNTLMSIRADSDDAADAVRNEIRNRTNPRP